MDGLPVTVRLLDPPLHEFLPSVEELIVQDAQGRLPAEGKALLAAARHWQEQNPMLGLRGVRLGIVKVGLYRMQVRALVEAALRRQALGGRPVVEIMIPLVINLAELDLTRRWVEDEVATVLAEHDARLDVTIGTMIETPRAAIRAADIARAADFFSFGTNDLTQMTFGFSRDDVAPILESYLEQGLLAVDPFKSIDQPGVGELVSMAVERGRSTKPGLKMGVCGEHGGDPESVAFFHDLGIDYVSCSPFRVPVARLAAAHAVLAATDRVDRISRVGRVGRHLRRSLTITGRRVSPASRGATPGAGADRCEGVASDGLAATVRPRRSAPRGGPAWASSTTTSPACGRPPTSSR